MSTLLVIATRQQAAAAGFINDHHAIDPELYAWWPGADEERLRGVVWARVIVTGAAARHAEVVQGGLPQSLQRGLAIVRSMLRTPPMAWIEL